MDRRGGRQSHVIRRSLRQHSYGFFDPFSCFVSLSFGRVPIADGTMCLWKTTSSHPSIFVHTNVWVPTLLATAILHTPTFSQTRSENFSRHNLLHRQFHTLNFSCTHSHTFSDSRTLSHFHIRTVCAWPFRAHTPRVHPSPFTVCFNDTLSVGFFAFECRHEASFDPPRPSLRSSLGKNGWMAQHGSMDVWLDRL